MEKLCSVYGGKSVKCLILGANGFIGRNIVEAMDESEYDLILFDKEPVGYLQNDFQRKNKRHCILHDTFSMNTNFKALTQGVDIVYHLISTTLPNNSNVNIGDGLMNNVVATSLLLDACVDNNVKKVIFLSSGGTVYGTSSCMPLNENSNNNPITGYGLQKITIEKLLYVYWYIYGLDYRIIRLSNPYGKYQKPNGVQGVITTFVYKIMHNEEVCVYGDGSVIRDYIYIDDAVQAIQKIANYQGENRLFNVGSGKGYSVNEVISIIEAVVGKKAKVIYNSNRKSDVLVNILDIRRYEECLGKIINIALDEGIRKTYQYFKENYTRR